MTGGRAGLGGRRAVRGRRGGAQADGRLRAAAEGRHERGAVIDGKAVAADVRARVAAGVARVRRGARRARRPGSRRCWSATTRPPQIYVAQQAPPHRGGRDALDPPRARRRRPRQAELLDLVAELNADDEVDGILVQLPLPDQHRPGRGDRARSTRARTSTASPRRAPGCSPRGGPGLVPCTPPGVIGAAAPTPGSSSTAPRR